MQTGIRQYVHVHILPEGSLVNIFSHTTDTDLCVFNIKDEIRPSLAGLETASPG